MPFKRLRSFYESGFSVPLLVTRKDRVSPWELYQSVYPKSPRSVFLDSSRGPAAGRLYRPPAQRYSYLAWRPYLHMVYRKGGGVFHQLRKLFLPIKIPRSLQFDFFPGGAVGYFGYELAQELDRISFRPKQGPSLPRLELLFFRDLVVFDHREGSYHLISWLIPQKRLPFSEALREAERRLHELEEAFRVPPQESRNGRFEFRSFHPEISQDGFERMVARTKEYIAAGDIYQANLSQRFAFTYQGSPLRLYGRLRQTNPSPFSAALHLGDLFIASSSPELLIEKKGRLCVTCPIAGTRPRGRRPAETRRLARELLQNEKERAEHLMLVDLERNDLGRVSEWRSVRVKDFMRLEKYARVIHIVSEIQSRLRPEKDAWDLIQAIFPGGTITGCPKIRSMEIIDELEPVERGVYTGSLGYIGFDGNLKLNIAIRTLVLLGKQGYLQVGAGIVADSDPVREYEETLHKGEALAEALIQASA